MFKNSSKTLIIPIDCSSYEACNKTGQKFRKNLDQTIEQYPELFPKGIQQGYDLQGFSRKTIKMPVTRRIIQIKNTGSKYLIHPCFILPYLRGLTIEVSKGLRLRKESLSYDLIASTCGRNAMFWYRLEMSLSRKNIVGTTVKSEDKMPKHILVDEHHNRLNKQKIYIGTTVGSGCFLGAQITTSISSIDLTSAYQIFKNECFSAFPNHKILTINTDGFYSTVKRLPV